MKNILKKDTLRSRWQYARQEHFMFLRFVLITFLIAIIYFGLAYFLDTIKSDWWDKWLNPATGLVTLVVAIGVWVASITQEWEARRPKRLTVIFKIKENGKYREVMRCNEAYLADAADIRTWGQQVGGQMVGNRSLQFEPFIDQSEPELKRDKKGKFYLFYQVIFYLTELPVPQERFIKSEAQRKKIEEGIKTKTLVWEPSEGDPFMHSETFVDFA